MPTNKIVLRSIEQIMSDFQPSYKPLFPLMVGAKAEKHVSEVGQLTFRRVEAVGDIRQKHITPKDTELKQIAAKEGSKVFKKYFLANQYQQSTFQSTQDAESVIAQALDEHNIHQDELLLLGEGTSASNMVNNGLYWSNDPNYELETSYEIPTSNRLYAFHNKVMANAEEADLAAGRKVIIFYGSSVLGLVNSLYDTAAKSWKSALGESLGSDYSIMKMPASCTPSAANGWIIVNLDKTKLNYTEVPKLMDQGYNAESMYYWFNFVMASMMVEVLADKGILRQPATLE